MKYEIVTVIQYTVHLTAVVEKQKYIFNNHKM